MTSLAELDNRVFQGLSAAGEYLDLEDVHNAVVQRLNARTMQARTSNINVLLGTTAEFTPTATPHDITALIGKGVPAWVETKLVINNAVEQWRSVRVVTLQQLGQYQANGILCCAFEGQEPANNTSQATQYLHFSYLPSTPCRIRFDRDGERKDLDADMLLPANVAELIVLEAQNSLVPRIKISAAMRTRSDEEGRAILGALNSALDALSAQNVVDMQPLIGQWKVWAFRDRSEQSAFNKPTPSGANLSPGGRHNWGSWSSPI